MGTPGLVSLAVKRAAVDFSDSFYHHMGTWLDADEFQVDDEQVVEDRVFGFACALANGLTDSDQFDDLMSRLKVVADAPEWDGTFLRRAIEMTNVDWTADEATGEVLRRTIRIVIKELADLKAQRVGARPES